MLLIITPQVHSWCKMTCQQEFTLLPRALQTLSIPLAPTLSDTCHLTKWQGRLVILTQAYLCYWYYYFSRINTKRGLPRWLSGKQSVCQCRRDRRHGFNPTFIQSGRSPGEGDDNPHQHSCLENIMDRGGSDNPLQCSWLENAMNRGTWPATVHGFAKRQAWLGD